MTHALAARALPLLLLSLGCATSRATTPPPSPPPVVAPAPDPTPDPTPPPPPPAPPPWPGCDAMHGTAQPSQTGPLTIEPDLEERDMWAGASMHYAQSYSGFDRAGRAWTHCWADQCEVFRSGAPTETVRGSLRSVDGRRDARLFAQLRQRGFDAAARASAGPPTRAWPYARDLTLTWSHEGPASSTGDATNVTVRLRERTTQATVLLARFDGPDERAMILWSVDVSPDGTLLGLAGDSVDAQRGALVDLRDAAARAYTAAAEAAWSRRDEARAAELCALATAARPAQATAH